MLSMLQKSALENIKIILTEEEKQSKLLKSVVIDEDKKDKKSNPVRTMILKIARTPVHKLNNVIFKKMLVKMIGFFYEELQKSDNITDFGDFVYNSLQKKYIMKKAVENRFLHLLSSCLKYRTITRVKTFSRFLGLFDELDSMDLKFYLDCLSFLQTSSSGGQLIYSETTETYLVPYTRCQECVKNVSKLLPSDSLEMIKENIEKLKKINRQNLKGVLEIDDFLEILIDSFSLNKRNNRNFMRLIYEAADLNNDGYLQYREFELLVKFLSNRKFKQLTCLELFNNYAENFMAEDDEQVKAISFMNLCQLDKEEDLFNQALIYELTGVHDEEEASRKVKVVEGNLDNILEEIKWRFSQNTVWDDHNEELDSLLFTLRNKFKAKSNPEELCLALRLLEEDSKRSIVGTALIELLPIVGAAFCNVEESALERF